MKILKNTFRLLALTLVLLLATACPPPVDEDDIFLEEEALPKDGDMTSTLSLRLTLETEQDQIGDFADNAMAVFNGVVWSVGGKRPLVSLGFNSEVWKSTNAVAWESVVFEPFAGRIGHTLTVYDGKLWLIGGLDNDGRFLGEVWSSEDGINWSLITDSPAFFDAAFHDVVVFNNKLYLMADRGGAERNVSIWSSTNGSDWLLEADSAFSGREEFKAVVFEDVLYVIGGKNSTTLDPMNEIWMSADGTDWIQLETNSVFTPRSSHTATVYRNKVFVAGGRGTSGAEGNLWYTEDMVNWFEYEPLTSEIGISDHAALTFGDKLWLFGGLEGTGFSGAITGKIRSITEE